MTLREELLGVIYRRGNYYRKQASMQNTSDVEGLTTALHYTCKAEALDTIASELSGILQQHFLKSNSDA